MFNVALGHAFFFHEGVKYEMRIANLRRGKGFTTIRTAGGRRTNETAWLAAWEASQKAKAALP